MSVVTRSLAIVIAVLITLLACPYHCMEIVDREISSAIVKKNFLSEFIKYYETRIISNELTALVAAINKPQALLSDLPKATNPSACLKCRVGVNAVIGWFDQLNTNGTTVGHLKLVLKDVCHLLTATEADVCLGYAAVFSPSIYYMLNNKVNRSVDYGDGVCGVLLQYFQCGSSGYVIDFDLEIDVGDAVLLSPKTYDRDVDPNNITVVHLTDFHYDPLYAEGSSSVCKEGICCRNSSKFIDGNRKTAGKWGDYEVCDSPSYLIENICHQAAVRHQNVEIVYYTGDFVDHFEWVTSRDSIMNSIRFITDVLKREFPNKLVVPVLGNHDTHPSNLFAPSTIEDESSSIRWLYDFVAEQWKDWLPEHALDTLRSDGYYTFVLRPGLRVISLNSNVCYTKNLWLFFENKSLRKQLQWFADVLQLAETSNEKVHILGHIPPNSRSGLEAWQRAYVHIVRRFAHIISGAFHGHSHYDELSLMFRPHTSDAINVAWVAGSGTSFVELNPNYRLYYVDGQSFEVLDHDTWIFNLTETNAAVGVQPNWFKEYTFKEYFNVTSLSPNAIGELVRQPEFLQMYWITKVKNSDPLLKAGCDNTCFTYLLADILEQFDKF